MTSRTAHIRLSTLGVAALLTVGLTACSSSTSGSGSAAAAGGSSSSAAASASPSASAAGDITSLAAQLVAGTAKATTVHLKLDTEGTGSAASAASAAGSGEGDVKTKDGGTTDQFQFAVGSGDAAIALVYVDGTGYVKLPAAQQTDPSKPWAKVTDGSTNPAVAAIAKGFDQVDQQTSLTQYAALLKGASNFQATGPSDVDGTKVQGYTFDIDPKSLPSAAQLGDAASQLGPIPTTMAVDDQGRPVQVVEKISVAGQTITTTVTFSNYGKSVTISAPPADQTSTG